MTAPPHGLHLAAVYYPERYGIAKNILFNKLAKDARRHD
jgi:tRNA pseudouridine38-40 synthase